MSSYRGILKKHREQLLATGVSEVTAEVAVLRLRHPKLRQGELAAKLGITQPAVSQHLSLARAAIPEWEKLLRAKRGRPPVPRVQRLAA